MIDRESIEQENIKILNINAPKKHRPKIFEENSEENIWENSELKWEINYSKVKTGGFDTTLSIMSGRTRQKINKEIEDVNNIGNQLYLTHTYTEHSTQLQQNAHFSQGYVKHSSWWTLCDASKQVSINFIRLKSYKVLFSNHKGMKLQINDRSKTVKCTDV